MCFSHRFFFFSFSRSATGPSTTATIVCNKKVCVSSQPVTAWHKQYFNIKPYTHSLVRRKKKEMCIYMNLHIAGNLVRGAYSREQLLLSNDTQLCCVLLCCIHSTILFGLFTKIESERNRISCNLNERFLHLFLISFYAFGRDGEKKSEKRKIYVNQTIAPKKRKYCQKINIRQTVLKRYEKMKNV